MLIGVYNYHQGTNQNNSMFNNPKIDIGDDLMKPFKVLKKYFNDKGHNICSVNDYSIEKFDAILFIEYPTLPFLLNQYFRKYIQLNKKMYLLLMESEIIRPSNFNINNHKYFEKVFTWKDSIVDNKKYIKFCIPQNIPNKVLSINKNRKLCTLISSNKLHNHKYELYSERINAIRFFEKNNIEFDLYGMGRNYFTFKNSKINFIGPLIPGFNFIKNIFHKKYFVPFPSWKGKIDSKYNTLSKYKFAICYENAKEIPGYITEKIFDCFFAGCIPIYLGAPNINKFIPENTYIDKNEYNSYEDLYKYISNMSEIEYNNYIVNIKKYLESEQIKQFSSEKFSNILYNNIIT